MIDMPRKWKRMQLSDSKIINKCECISKIFIGFTWKSGDNVRTNIKNNAIFTIQIS